MFTTLSQYHSSFVLLALRGCCLNTMLLSSISSLYCVMHFTHYFDLILLFLQIFVRSCQVPLSLIRLSLSLTLVDFDVETWADAAQKQVYRPSISVPTIKQHQFKINPFFFTAHPISSSQIQPLTCNLLRSVFLLTRAYLKCGKKETKSQGGGANSTSTSPKSVLNPRQHLYCLCCSEKSCLRINAVNVLPLITFCA